MKFVVDASVAVKWVVEEDGRAAARSLLSPSNDILAPDLVLTEVGNVLWKKVRRGEIPASQAESAMDEIEDCFDLIEPSGHLVSRALRMAIDLDHPIYDCLYFAYAERQGATFVTDDRRAQVKGQRLASIEVRLLADDTLSPH